MAQSKDFPLRLVIQAVDNATLPLKRINEQFRNITAPVRKLNNSLQNLSAEARLPKLVGQMKGIGLAAKNVASESARLFSRVALGASAAAFGIASYIKKTATSGEELSNLAQSSGTTVDYYASLEFAAKKAGMSSEEFTDSIANLNRRVGELRTNKGELKDFFENSNLSVFADQIKKAKDIPAILELVVKASNKIKGKNRLTFLSAFFGDGAKNIINFASLGNEGIAKLQKQFIELAGSQEGYVKKSKDIYSSSIDLDAAITGVSNSVTEGIAPSFTGIINELTKIISSNREEIKKWATDIGKIISDWKESGGLERLIEDFKKARDGTKEVINMFGGFNNAIKIIGIIIASDLILSVAKLGLACVKLGIDMGLAGAKLAIWLGPVLKTGLMFLGTEGVGAVKALYGALSLAGASFGSALVAIAPFAAAAAGLAAVGYAIYKNWDDIKTLFTDFTGPGGLLGTLKEMLSDIRELAPDKWFGTAFKWWGKELGITSGDAKNNAQQPIMNPISSLLGADKAAPGVGSVARSKAEVSVSFNNVPRGVAISSNKEGPIDLSINRGLSMGLE